MGGELSLKLPFTLMHTCPEHGSLESIAHLKRQKSMPQTDVDVRPDKDGTKTWSNEKLAANTITKTTNDNQTATTSQDTDTDCIDNSSVDNTKCRNIKRNEDLDAIITETKSDNQNQNQKDTMVKMVTMVVEDRSFSGSRSWCCLGARRSS